MFSKTNTTQYRVMGLIPMQNKCEFYPTLSVSLSRVPTLQKTANKQLLDLKYVGVAEESWILEEYKTDDTALKMTNNLAQLLNTV